MSTSEKLQTIENNMQGVFDAGRSSVIDGFWTRFEADTSRTNYSYAFYGRGWTDELFKPKGKIYPVGDGAKSMFEGSKITRVSHNIVDFSKTSEMIDTFRGSDVNSVKFVIVSLTKMKRTFAASKIKNINLTGLRVDCTFDKVFQDCVELENINNLRQMMDHIGQNGFDVSDCTLLEYSCLIAILRILEDYSTDMSGTQWVCTLGGTNLDKLTDEEKAIATVKGWSLI